MTNLSGYRNAHAIMASTLLYGSLIAFACACGGGGSGGGGGTTPGTGAPDADGDGLSDALEAQNGTDPFNPDTDEDGLGDFSEVFGPTEALNPDTDGDQILDGVEVDLGTDPLVFDDPSFLRGMIVLPDGSPAAGAAITLAHDSLSQTYPGFVVRADSVGLYSFDEAWPTQIVLGSTIHADSSTSGTLFASTQALPVLVPGTVTLPPITLAFQPYTRGMNFYIPIPYVDSFLDTVFATMVLINPGSVQATVSWDVSTVSASVFNQSGSVTIPPEGAIDILLPVEDFELAVQFPYTIEYVEAGVSVSADRPISVVIHIYNTDNSRGGGAYTCLPTTSYGKDYYIRSFESGGIGAQRARGSFAVATAGAEDSVIQMVFSDEMTFEVSGTPVTFSPGSTVSAPVNFKDSVQCVLSSGDLSGSRLVSSRPIGLVSGTTDLSYGTFSWNSVRSSVVIETVAPVEQWGTSFVSFGGIGDLPSQIVVQGGAQVTGVSFDGGSPTQLGPGKETVYTPQQNGAVTILSDNPVLVWQVFGWSTRGSAGVNLAPIERWSTNETLWAFSARNQVSSVAVIAQRSSLSQVLLDGASVASLLQTTILDVNSQYVVLVTPVSDGDHVITCTETVFPMVFGRSIAGSDYTAYAYSPVW